MTDDNSDVMPYYEVNELKKQMKKMQDAAPANSDQLLGSMSNLTKSMDSMLQLFKTAAEEMKLEEQEESALGQQMKPLMDKLNEIIEQNKIIAEGMVAISDLVKERLPDRPIEQEQKYIKQAPLMPRGQPQQQPMFPNMAFPPPMPGPMPSGPPPMDLPSGMDFPPPPPPPPAKKGNFKK